MDVAVVAHAQHAHGARTCHWLSLYSTRAVMENQIGRPVLFSASRIRAYCAHTRDGSSNVAGSVPLQLSSLT
jgi:hypothetical protein